MPENYDLVVIGTGTAAMVAAMQVRASGKRVAVVDYRPIGGTCALRGCDPKKVLVGGARALDHARRMQGKGIAGDIRMQWPDLIAFKRTFTDPVPEKYQQRYADKGIDTWRGWARFTGRNSLDVDGTALEAEHVLIAAGAEPVRLGIPGEEHLITQEDFLALPTLPERIVLVGGGFIAAEFSHIAAAGGAQVTILQHGKRLLKPFDPDLVEWLMESFRERGIEVRTEATVEAIEKTDKGYQVHVSSRGEPLQIKADLVIHAAGRAPALDKLDLATGGIDTHERKLKLNDYLQSVSNPAIYAAGDAAQMGPPLTPVSSHDAKVVAANLLEGNHRKPDYRGVPSVAFSIPPIAAAGLSEAEARRQGRKFRLTCQRASDWYTARQAAEPIYGFKVMVDEESDLILGAHLVGPHADEVINLFAMAIRHELTAEVLRTTTFAYPTGASDIGYMI